MTRMRIKPVVGIPVAAGCLLVGILLIVGFVGSVPPDPVRDDAEGVIAYLLDDDFHELPIARRRAYVEALVQRYGEMDEAQRRRVDEQVRRVREDDPDRMRDQMVRIWKDYVVSEGRRYLEVPPEQRRDWLERRVAVWKRMMPGGRGRRDDDRKDRGGGEGRGRPMDEVLTPERQRKVLSFFQDEVMPHTSAADRAVVTLLARDVMTQFRNEDWWKRPRRKRP